MKWILKSLNVKVAVEDRQLVRIITIQHQVILEVLRQCDRGNDINWQTNKQRINVIYLNASSESTDHERQRDRNGERPTTMSGSAIAWELFLWFSCRLSKIIEFRTTGLSQSVIIDTASVASHNFIQSSSAKLKTIGCGSRYETANNSTSSITSRGLVRYSVYILVPISAIAAAVFCKCSKNGASDV